MSCEIWLYQYLERHLAQLESTAHLHTVVAVYCGTLDTKNCMLHCVKLFLDYGSYFKSHYNTAFFKFPYKAKDNIE